MYISIFIGICISFKLILSILNVGIAIQENTALVEKINSFTNNLLISAPVFVYVPFVAFFMLLLTPILFKSKKMIHIGLTFSFFSIIALVVYFPLLGGDMPSNFSVIIITAYCIYAVLFISMICKRIYRNILISFSQERK